MDIIFNPPVNKENQYIQVLVGELRAKGYQVHALDDIFSSFKHFKSIKLVHLNWFENVDDSGFFVALRSFFRKLVVLIAIRISGKPLLWTMHNRTSHEQGLTFFSRTITRLLIRWSHHIIIHTHESEHILASYGAKIVQKAVYLPHPNFIGMYGDIPVDVARDESKLHLLFTGMVKPYKNLELLIEVVSGLGNKVQLTIAGKAIDAKYEWKIMDMAREAGNVELMPYFVPDNEIAALIAKADVLVLPYDLSSSLNSGTVVLAFSYKKTVICPEIGTITDMGAHQADIFHYRYHTGEEHHTALREQIMRAATLKRHNPAALHGMANRLYEYVDTIHDKHLVGAQLDEIYRTLMNNRA